MYNPLEVQNRRKRNQELKEMKNREEMKVLIHQREALGINLSVFAKAMGTTTQRLNRLEKGLNVNSREVLILLYEVTLEVQILKKKAEKDSLLTERLFEICFNNQRKSS